MFCIGEMHWTNALLDKVLVDCCDFDICFQAVNLILAPRDNDVPDLRRCHNTWKETGDAEAALKMLCKGWESTVESQLLTGLTQMTGNDLVEALNRVRLIANAFLDTV